jgi:epoxyqueuosine reductase QueG
MYLANMETLTKGLKKFAVNEGAALLGIASVERLIGAPEGRRPSDHLPKTKSAISIAVEIPKTVCDTWDHVSHNHYRWYGHKFLNDYLQIIAYKLTLFLEERGYSALPFPPTISAAGGAEISHRHVAVAAGLGDFGWAGYVLTPQFGARQRFTTILTDANLDSDSVYSGPTLCNPEECGYQCVDVCPMNALSKTEKKNCTIGGIDFDYTSIDRWKCSWAVSGLIKKVGGWKDIPFPDQFKRDSYLEAMKQRDYFQIRTEIAQGGHATYCGKCQAICPVASTQW